MWMRVLCGMTVVMQFTKISTLQAWVRSLYSSSMWIDCVFCFTVVNLISLVHTLERRTSSTTSIGHNAIRLLFVFQFSVFISLFSLSLSSFLFRDLIILLFWFLVLMTWRYFWSILQNASRYVWTVRDFTAGYAQWAGNVTYLVVLGAGHMVPYQAPVASLDMFIRFLYNHRFDTQYVQFYAGPPTPAPASGSLPVWAWILIIIGASLVCGVLSSIITWRACSKSSSKYETLN